MSYLDREEELMDLGLRRSLRWRRVRRWLVMLTLLGLFVEFRGVPHFRLSDRSRPRGGQVEYWSPLGVREMGEGGPTPPLIVLLRLDRSLWSYAREAGSELYDKIAGL